LTLVTLLLVVALRLLRAHHLGVRSVHECSVADLELLDHALDVLAAHASRLIKEQRDAVDDSS
jgi:hypothetical protein